jgi:hypothetical protein
LFNLFRLFFVLLGGACAQQQQQQQQQGSAQSENRQTGAFIPLGPRTRL